MTDKVEGASSADSTEGGERHVTFNVKASNNQNFNGLTFPASATIKDVKEKLSTPDLANIPADRIRLIYSGRVLKDPDTLATCKPEIKDGYTIHMVKGADSNSRQNPASTSSGTQAVPTLPTNLAAGTGNDALAGLTGARYAGFHGLPNASMFGADGGVSFFQLIPYPRPN
jgi:ubiquilin